MKLEEAERVRIERITKIDELSRGHKDFLIASILGELDAMSKYKSCEATANHLIIFIDEKLDMLTNLQNHLKEERSSNE